MKKFYYSIIIILYFSLNLYGQEIKVKTGVDKSVIHIGDYIKYFIEISYKKGIKVELPAPGENLGEFDIKDYNVVNLKSNKKNIIKKRIEYKITTYFLGDFQIPAITISYLDKNKNRKRITTEPILIKVVPVKKKPGDSDDIRDIKKPYYLPDYTLYYILGIISILLLLFVFYWFYLRKKLEKNKEKVEVVKKENLLPEDIEAFNKIEELVKKELIEKGLIKEFYFELSEIIREYLHRRYEIETLERTSGEILRDLKKILNKENFKLFEKFFNDTDMVKFAKYKPTKNELNNIIPFTKDLIEITKRKREVIEKNENS